MQTNDAPRGGAHERRAAWAEQFAQRRRHIQDVVPVDAAQAEDWIPRAVSALWAPIDDAVDGEQPRRQRQSAIEGFPDVGVGLRTRRQSLMPSISGIERCR